MFCFNCKNEWNCEYVFTGGRFKNTWFYLQTCGPFTKNIERIEKFMQTGNTDFIYKNQLEKACFQHDMAYGKSKDLAKRTQSDKS